MDEFGSYPPNRYPQDIYSDASTENVIIGMLPNEGKCRFRGRLVLPRPARRLDVLVSHNDTAATGCACRVELAPVDLESVFVFCLPDGDVDAQDAFGEDFARLRVLDGQLEEIAVRADAALGAGHLVYSGSGSPVCLEGESGEKVFIEGWWWAKCGGA